MNKTICWVFLVLSFHSVHAQDEYPKDYFKSPLNIPLFLAGNFGEIRPNHFHAGLDLKTEGVEGKPILAAADGYVSRIKISIYGYGKVLYITHPNGYTTAYAHLQKFNDEIEAFVKKAQYYKETFEIELFPGSRQLKVKQSDTIAISGNTGGSGGPHLHFEIRETDTEVPVNPLKFGFDINDNIKPIIRHLAIYPMNEMSLVNGKPVTRHIPVSGADGKYRISSKDKITLHGDIGFGVETLDKLNGSNNRCGVFSIELFVDSQQVYAHEMDRIGFHETRYINCHVDYESQKKTGRLIQKSFLEPNNQLKIYKNLDNNGLLSFRDDNLHTIDYVIKDTYGNTSSLNFKVQSVSKADNLKHDLPDTKTGENAYFAFDRPNSFETEYVKVKMPAGILYKDLYFSYALKDTIKGAITPTHHIHNPYVSLQSYMELSIRVDSINEALKPKALIVALNEQNQVISPEGGEWKDGFLKIKTRSLGPYTVMLDTVPPRIKPLNIFNKKNMSGTDAIMVKITDNLSDIDIYRGTIDGKWILMEYERKNARLTYYFDDSRIGKGEHTFKLVVTDHKGNKSEYSCEFTR